MNMQDLMAQAQRMQRDINKKKDELENTTFVGKSEWVEVTYNGAKVLQKISILKEGVNEVTKFGEEKDADNNNNNIITPEEGNKSNNIGANYQNKENGDNKGIYPLFIMS